MIVDDMVVVEGMNHEATTAEGTERRGGVTHARRSCEVFETRDSGIRRPFMYLDPDYAGTDTSR